MFEDSLFQLYLTS